MYKRIVLLSSVIAFLVLSVFGIESGFEIFESSQTTSLPTQDASVQPAQEAAGSGTPSERERQERSLDRQEVARSSQGGTLGDSDSEEDQVKRFKMQLEEMRKTPGAQKLIDEILVDIEADLAEGRDLIDPSTLPVDDTGVPYLEEEDAYGWIQNERLRSKMRKLDQILEEADQLQAEQQEKEKSK